MRIRKLPPLLANQISAGEVIERPAAVVKELLENAVDSGAMAIEVCLERGGLKLVQVTDDGRGIEKDDLPLAVMRHATSKLETQADLHNIMTLGFRGEALASICACSRVTLDSRVEGASTAWQIAVAGFDEQPILQPSSLPVGTRVSVQDLFFNTPARRKFCRTEKTEFEHCAQVFKRVALSHFGIAFTLKHNGKTVLHLPAANDTAQKERRMQKVMGEQFIANATYLEAESEGLRLYGWATLPPYSRMQMDWQYVVLNGRMIRDKLVNQAIRQAYREALPQGRHAAFVLFLEVSPSDVDVNVHPTKHEVRFSDGRRVYDFILHHLYHTLFDDQQEDGVSVDSRDEVTRSHSVPYHYPNAHHLSRAEYSRPASVKPARAVSFDTDSDMLLKSVVHNRICILEVQDGIKFIHIGQARTAILRAQLALVCGGEDVMLSQPLLIPEVLPVNEKQLQQFESQHAIWQQFGFGVQVMGPSKIVLREKPTIFPNLQLGQFFSECWSQLTDGTSLTEARFVEVVCNCALAAMEYESLNDMAQQALISELQEHQLLDEPSITHSLSLSECEAWYA